MWVQRKLSGLLLLVLAIGVTAPALLWAAWDIQRSARQQQQAFAQEIQQFQRKLESGLQSPLWDLAPDSAAPLLDAQFQDRRLASLTVLTDARQLFYHHDEASRRDGQCTTHHLPVYRQTQLLGEALAEFCDGALQAQIAQQRSERLWLIGGQFGLTLMLIVALLHWRLVLPVRQLVAQAQALAERRLAQPFTWLRRDELRHQRGIAPQPAALPGAGGRSARRHCADLPWHRALC